MATVASTIINDASTQLNDAGVTRWTTAELLSYLNRGQLEIATLVPNSNTATVSKQLAAGAKQTAPSDSIRIIEFVRNMGANGSTDGNAIRQIERKAMDRYIPSWSSDTATAVVVHAMYDAEDNNAVFYVWPPQPVITPQYIELIYSQIPATIAASTNNITIADYYSNALLDYVLYRAFDKDSDSANQSARSQAHYQTFVSAIGAKFTADTNANNTPQVK